MIKLYAWLAYDVFLAGLLAYSWVVLQVQLIASAMDTIEKFILFLCTACFAVYRIYHLHLDGVRKKIEIKKMHFRLILLWVFKNAYCFFVVITNSSYFSI